jgi:hypothetical protein
MSMHLVRLCYISKRTGCDSNGWDDWRYHTLNWSDQVLYGAMIYWKCFSMDGCRGTRRSKMSCQWSDRATKSWEMSAINQASRNQVGKAFRFGYDRPVMVSRDSRRAIGIEAEL